MNHLAAIHTQPDGFSTLQLSDDQSVVTGYSGSAVPISNAIASVAVLQIDGICVVSKVIEGNVAIASRTGCDDHQFICLNSKILSHVATGDYYHVRVIPARAINSLHPKNVTDLKAITVLKLNSSGGGSRQGINADEWRRPPYQRKICARRGVVGSSQQQPPHVNT